MDRELIRWRWRYGRPADFWLSHIDTVAAFIKEHKLRAVERENLQVIPEEKSVIDIDDIIGSHGGRKLAHLHYRGDIYLLNDNQWKAFSNKIIGGFAEKLANAKTVNFEQLIQLSDAMGSII